MAITENLTVLSEKYNYKIIRQGRKSGILLHISSLPSPYGIGTMGKAAYEFIDFLQQAGQSYWQILPLGITGFGDSPYQSFSTRAGNPYLIDLDLLVEDGLLKEEEIEHFDFGKDPEKVDFHLLWENRYQLLKLAWLRFNSLPPAQLHFAFEEFLLAADENWLHDFALFMSIKKKYEGKPWRSWPDGLKHRDEISLREFACKFETELLLEKFLQFLFFLQWQNLHQYAREKGVYIAGDLPIYVADDSVEVWSEPDLFLLDELLYPSFVAGTPPDAFSDSGQLWGNPLYDWPRHEADGYAWWIERIRFQLDLYDLLRLDHFRGFESYWVIPFGDETARRGHWRPGPADKLFTAVKNALGELPIFAEDLGYMTKEVSALRERTGFPGMKVLQFAFNPHDLSDYLPHNLIEHSVLYTGTHDNDTIAGWLATATAEEVEFAVKYLGLNDAEGKAWGLMRGAATTVSQTVIFQMQDLLGLDNDSRMNRPGTSAGNWRWRMREDQLTTKLVEKLRDLTKISGRLAT